MKKFLSLVLALVMTMSLVTISAGAKTFEDDDAIDYTEAVEVMKAVKVIDGYADGSFNPAATLTRGAAAKIICNMILGPTTAGALVADAAPYKDVPANSTFAGYIAYCQKEGIISGYADGTFKPGNTLTGYAFMKMLLGALGYDKASEGYEGANWSINVAKQAIAIGLDDGLQDDFNGTKPVTRQEACLYAFNTMKAVLVEYSDKTTITTGSVAVTTSGVRRNVTAGGTTKINNKTENGNQLCEFAEKYFTNLKKDSTVTDAFGRPATKWTVKSTEIGTYAETADLTYTGKVKQNTLYKDIDLDSNYTGASYYSDQETTVHYTTQCIDKGNEDAVAESTTGTYTEVFYNSDKDDIKIVTINPYVGKVTSVGKNSDGDREIRIAYAGGTVSYETDDFAKNDTVIFAFGKDGKDTTEDDGGIKMIELAEVQSGKVTKKVGSDTVYIDGTKYSISKSAGKSSDLSANVKDIVDYVVEPVTGTIIKLKASDKAISVANLAYVESANNYQAYGNGYQAVLRYADGSKKTVKTDDDYTAYNHYLVTFEVDDDDKVKLDSDDDKYYYYAGGNAAYTKGNPTLAGSYTNWNGGSLSNVPVNGSTTFVYVTTDANGKQTGKVYEGYKNAPSFANADVRLYLVDGKASVVFVYVGDGDVSNAGKDSFIIFDSGKDLSKDLDNNNYYEYLAIIEGEIKTVMVSNAASAWNNLDSTADGYVTGVSNYAANKNGVITSISATSYGAELVAGEYIKAVDNETIVINDASKGGEVGYAYTDKTVVYLVNDDLDAVETLTVDDIYEGTVGDQFAAVYYTWDSTDTYVLKTVVLVEK